MRAYKVIREIIYLLNMQGISFSGRPYTTVRIVGSMEVIVGGKKTRRWHVCCTVLHYISYTKFSQILWDSYHIFGSRNSPTTGILHTIRHVYRSV